MSDTGHRLAVEYRPIASIAPYERNARTHSPDQVKQIAASMEEFGWTNPILLDEEGGIIAGHGRLEAAKLRRMTEVPCITLRGLTDVQRRAVILADNQLALNAGWDEDLLAMELGDLKDDGFDLDVIGFSAEDLTKLLSGPVADGLTDPDDAPPAPVHPVTRLGDVWLMGPHRIVCGDCTDADVVARVLNGVTPNLMVTDPPWGVKYDPSWRVDRGVAGKVAAGKVLNDDRADWREAWALFPGNVCYVWHAGLHCGEVEGSLNACGFRVRAQIIWVKTRHALSRGHYHNQHEPAFFAERVADDGKPVAADGWQNRPGDGDGGADDRFDHQHLDVAYAVREGEAGEWRGGRKQSTVWFIEHLKSDTGHGTQKPVDAMKRPIENNSSPGQAIYEPFSGSGTTIIACQMTGRVAHASELSPAYVDVAVQRWQNFTGKKATLEGDGRTFEDIAAARPLE